MAPVPLQLRVLYPISIQSAELQAIRRGTERFRRFGVACEEQTVSRQAVRDVRAGNRLHAALTSSSTLLQLGFDAFHVSVREVIFPRTVLGFGLTSHPLLKERDDETTMPCLGISEFAGGAVVSVHTARTLDPDIAEPFLELAAVHELGHVFSSAETRHCTDARCLMQGNANYRDFIERFVRPGLDFCRACERYIEEGVRRIQEQFS